jgi:formylglycine-generating enzyme required for sulfatase activity
MNQRLAGYLFIFLTTMLSFIPVRMKAHDNGGSGAIFNLDVGKTDATLVNQDVVNQTVMVRFNPSWKYSWRNDLPGTGQAAPLNYDGLWIFVKYRVGNGPWRHATLDMSGMAAPDGFAFTAPPDKKGVFLHRAVNGFGDVNLTDVAARWDYAADGVSDLATVSTRLFTLEMVYVPDGSFYVGDNSPGVVESQFHAAGAPGFPPYQITSEAAIELGGTTLGNLTSRGSDDFNASTTQTLPATFPKGYQSFWIMKFELTSRQWCDFLNQLEPGQQPFHDTASFFGMERHAITKMDGAFVTTAPTRPVNFMNFDAVMAFADWAGLRPMTELEYEKVCRGPNFPVPDELAWGSTNIVQITRFNGTDGSGTETALPTDANCSYNLQNGSTNLRDQPIQGPVRVGIFLDTNPPTAENPTISRQLTGASYYWAFELSGNVWERCVGIGTEPARTYLGNHGDGALSATGQANEPTWPNLSGGGAGYRGGNWYRWSNWARVSSRAFGATHDPSGRTSHRGIRAVRTAPSS